MTGLSGHENQKLRRLLQDAVVKCSERCLYQSAKWAAELLSALPEQDPVSPADTEVDSPMSTDQRWDATTPMSNLGRNEDPKESRLEAAELDKYLLAKSYFDCREFDRCAAVFLPSTLPKGHLAPESKKQSPAKTFELPNWGFGRDKGKGKAVDNPKPQPDNATTSDAYLHLSQKALFLAMYAKYMSGEKRKEEDSEMVMGPNDNGSRSNTELPFVTRVLRARFTVLESRGESGQGWLEYLYGVVLAKAKITVDARNWLIRSVALCSFNWGAWQELSALITSLEELQQLGSLLPQNIMTFIFHIYEHQELFQTSDEILLKLKQLKAVFPGSSFLRTQKALLHYHSKDFEKAEHTFAKVVQTDPLRLDDLDTYSNILYVMEKRPKLAYLAQLTTATDKFRPETCCVVGNYYAMRSEHEKAVMYFRRALTLDRNFLSAWTLMGHEFVELKNTQAAIECYRRAVDINRKDYRALYGLGQTYEMLDMHFYALDYYKRAAALYPLDPKMWNAVGTCLAKMDRYGQAIKAYKRALAAGTYYDNNSSFGSMSQRGGREPFAIMDPDVLFSIATMYDRLNDQAEVRAYLELTLEQEEGPANAAEDEEGFRTSTATSHAGERVQGVGVTATTSRARMWIAKMEMALGGTQNLERAMILANELCQDGWEVEEAKSLIRDIRARMATDIMDA